MIIMNNEEKLVFICKHRAPVTYECLGGCDHNLWFGNKDKGTYHVLIDNSFTSLFDRAYSIVETELRSWGY